MALENLDELLLAVKKNKAYRQISDDLVRWVGARELGKRRYKDAVKQTRAKLHQVAGAYLGNSIDTAAWSAELHDLPVSLGSNELQRYCLRIMEQHVSTRERVPILPGFYSRVLQSIGKVHSILDVGCGLNTLALPWIPLYGDVCYFGLDIYEDLVAFNNRFLKHVEIEGEIRVHSMTGGYPDELPPVQVALLLKILPCLAQLDKTIPLRLLDGIRAEHVVVSFPVHSIGGRSKGMPDFYSEHFLSMIEGTAWHVTRFDFSSELVFLLQS